MKKLIIIITSALLLFALMSYLYIFNPNNLFENLGLRPNPKILYSHTNFTENLEQKQKGYQILNEINSDIAKQDNGNKQAIAFALSYDKRSNIEIDKQKNGWDCLVEVKVKNEGKTGLILIRVRYGENVKEESLIIKKNEYATLNFIFAKTHKDGKPSVEIKSLE